MVENYEESIECNSTVTFEENRSCSRNMAYSLYQSKKKSLLRSEVFCLSLALMIATCCFNFGFQYGVVDKQQPSSNFRNAPHLKAPTLRKLSKIVDVWDEDDDNWEDIELRRGHIKNTNANAKENVKLVEGRDVSNSKDLKNDENNKQSDLSEKEDVLLRQNQLNITNLKSSVDELGIPQTCKHMQPLDFNVILYNSLTMCASHILLNIAKYANNRLFVEDLKDPLHKSSHPEKDIVKYVDTKPLPSLFHSHTFFCPMSSTDERNITFISMVRNPLERLLSLYYSGTHAFRTAGVKVKSYNECVLSNDNVCVGNWTRHTLVHHFCGYDVKCAHASTWAFERAKYNIANKYLVVGIVADFERFMKLLEALAPIVFNGYSDLTVDMAKLLDKRIFGSNLDELSPEVKLKMEKHLEMDFQLYNFITRRYLKQLHAVM